MCGISILTSWKGPLPLQAIEQMNTQIRHRGPDDEGFTFFSRNTPPCSFGGKDTPENVYACEAPFIPSRQLPTKPPVENCHLAFGHRRLSILDLSANGHQPMCDQSQRYWITYNGEIYNHEPLRQELESLGHHFFSGTDTEVLLRSYIEWGEECLHRLNGMFSFGIYDRQEDKLFIARDRFGIKPLYYWRSPEGFLAIGSEIKQFTTLPGWNPRINGQAAYDFLQWSLTGHREETCFEDVYQLYGGHSLLLSLGQPPQKITPKQWYTLPVGKYKGSFADASHEFAELMRDSVRLRSRADVPVGSCLSGGLDSSAIVCLLHQIIRDSGATNQQTSFSACTQHKRFDERHFAEMVVDQTGVKPHYLYPDVRQLIEDLDSIVWHQDEPFGSTSIYAQWEVFKSVKSQNIKVMLDGQGADEQLAGYSGFHGRRFVDLLRELRWVALYKEVRACQAEEQIKGQIKHAARRTASRCIKTPIQYLLGRSTQSQLQKRSPWLNMEQLGAVAGNPHNLNVPTQGAVQSLSYAQVTRTNLPMLLHYEDRDSMAHSIEARTPFLDYRLVEFIQSLPAEFKLANGETKRVMREGMKGILPEKIRTRRDKLGFATPEEIWVQKENPDLFRKLVRESIEASEGIFNKETMNVAESIISGKAPFTFQVWRLIVFGRWMRQFSMKPSAVLTA